jgi:hypothetical protein
MTCSTHNKVRIDNSLDMTVWTRVALPVVAQDASLFWPDFATTGPHKDPVHSQASKVLVVIQQGLQFNLPAWFGTMATNGERAAGAAAAATAIMQNPSQKMDNVLLFHTTTSLPDATDADDDKMSLSRLIVRLEHRQESFKDKVLQPFGTSLKHCQDG